jgi:tRNA 2-thiouridine synthesizing protein A
VAAPVPAGLTEFSRLPQPKQEIAMSNTAQELDARGLNCPLPILRARKALNGLEHGQILRIRATDPGAVKDFDAFCKSTGNELISSEQSSGEYVFQIRKN